MKKRETKSGREDAGRRRGEGHAARTPTPDEDRLPGMMPDPERLSSVCRSPLVRAGSRWLSFARTLARGRRRLAVSDTLAFIESLYGRRFTADEGGGFSLDKVYRTAGGGLFVSETRLCVSVYPKFDLRLLNVPDARAGSQVFKETLTTTALTLLSHARVGDREQTRAAGHGTSDGVAPASSTTHTWNVLTAGAERLPPVFGYVNVPGRREQAAQGLESARALSRVERLLRGDAAARPSAETSRAPDASAPANLRLTNPDLRRPVTHAPRQEFVSVLLNKYLPVVESREILSLKTAGDLPVASPRQATGQGETAGRRFAHAPGVAERQPPAWTYREPASRHAPGSAVEIRREFRSTETVKEHSTARDPRPTMLQVLPPASLLLSLSKTSRTLLAGGAGGPGRTVDHSSGLAPALSLQLLRTHAAPSGTRVGSAHFSSSLPLDRTPPHHPQSGTREVLSPLYTFVGRVHSTFTGITHVGNSTFFTRPGFEPTLRRGFEQPSSRQQVASSEATAGHASARGLFGQTAELVRPAFVREFTREASTHDANTQIRPSQTQGAFSTRGAAGAGTFLFTAGLLRRSGGVSAAAGAMSPTAATALRPSAVETARAARPEGMALELIRHRREEVLQLPQPGYVFTQPARGQLEERQVITKASREEIVEVVRKEVRTLTSAAPATAAASRAELAGIADEVYSTLVRRLLVEKERLGRL